MLRTLLIASALLTACGTALAHSDYGYGRVVAVEPHFVISFGTRHHDGFRVLYESDGYRYWTNTSYYPGPTIVLPPPYRVERVFYRDYGRGRDERGWSDRRGGWRDEHREHHRHGRD